MRVDATPTEIKKAYKTFSLMYHPDKSDDPDAPVKFMRVSSAYEVLKDKAQRDAYNRFGATKAGAEESGSVATVALFYVIWCGAARSVPPRRTPPDRARTRPPQVGRGVSAHPRKGVGGRADVGLLRAPRAGRLRVPGARDGRGHRPGDALPAHHRQRDVRADAPPLPSVPPRVADDLAGASGAPTPPPERLRRRRLRARLRRSSSETCRCTTR